jgi:hypothetical protein
MKFRSVVLITFFCCAIWSCKTGTEKDVAKQKAPFDIRHSDPAAVELADSIIHAAGGSKAWEEIHFVTWLSPDDRMIYWDKPTGRVRMELLANGKIILLNTNTGSGRVQQNWKEISGKDSLNQQLEEAMIWWKTNSLELFIPFKLKDDGVTLTYLGEDKFDDSTKSNILQMVCKDSLARSCRYNLFVDLKNNEIKQWSQLKDEKSDSILVTRILDQRQSLGRLKISVHSSEGPKYLRTDQNVPDKIFEQF